VLVTRPEPGASATARRLAQAGFEPLVLPLTQTLALPPPTLPDPESVGAVAATSGNALRFAEPGSVGAFRGKPFFAVGASTAGAARHAGFADVREGGGDAASLARLMFESGAAPAVLFLCGRVRRPDFEAALRKGGATVAAVETYDTQALAPSPPTLAAVGPVDAALVYSVLAAQGLAALLRRRDAQPLLEGTALFALSPRIAGVLAPLRRCRAAAEPDENALFRLLEEWAGG
jgi:uroporphyrinogen-III synthase